MRSKIGSQLIFFFCIAAATLDYDFRCVFLTLGRDVLYRLNDLRAEKMVHAGLLVVRPLSLSLSLFACANRRRRCAGSVAIDEAEQIGSGLTACAMHRVPPGARVPEPGD